MTTKKVIFLKSLQSLFFFFIQLFNVFSRFFIRHIATLAKSRYGILFVDQLVNLSKLNLVQLITDRKICDRPLKLTHHLLPLTSHLQFFWTNQKIRDHFALTFHVNPTPLLKGISISQPCVSRCCHLNSPG